MEFMQGKLIAVYNPQLEQIRRKHYYEHSSDENVASLLGYSLIYYNTSLDDRDVVKRYYAKDMIERAFNQGYFSLKDLRKVKGKMGHTMLAFNMRRVINIKGVSVLVKAIGDIKQHLRSAIDASQNN